MSETQPAGRDESAVVRLPHDLNLRARLACGEASALPANELVLAFGVDGSAFYFKTPLDLVGYNSAVQVVTVFGSDRAAIFRRPTFIIPGESLDLNRGFFVIQTEIPARLRKENEARFIESMKAALSMMSDAKEAISDEIRTDDLSRLGENLKVLVENPDSADAWVKNAKARCGPGFPGNSFEFWKRIHALIFWDMICRIRKPTQSGKRGGGWDDEKAAEQLNQYFRNRLSHLGELEKYAKWKPYTARWLREFEANAGLSSKAPDGRLK